MEDVSTVEQFSHFDFIQADIADSHVLGVITLSHVILQRSYVFISLVIFPEFVAQFN